MVITVPCVKPKVCSLNKLFALALFPPEVTVTSEANALASLTNCAAGRVCKPLGAVISTSFENIMLPLFNNSKI